MKNPHITKTMGPIHFEDLDPKRFEDLVRELIYDLRDWQSIEATGRGGADDGFDVRGFEKVSAGEGAAIESDDDEFGVDHPMDGNMWMIQCKREKEIGPSRVEEIVAECIDAANPPYGYILVAPANFTKKAFDRFREALRARGVTEFYLWGRAALEDMLLIPKNDHLLFAFFGVSLSTRKRSRSSKIRSRISVKNKLITLLGENPTYAEVLLRDIDDDWYPDKRQCPDFQSNPKWTRLFVVGMQPDGLVVEISRHYAHCDSARGDWDAFLPINIVRNHSHDEDDGDDEGLRKKAESFWESLPSTNQMTLVRLGLVRFDDIAVVDSKGDSAYRMPHLFVVYGGNRGPFFRRRDQLVFKDQVVGWADQMSRTQIFPEVLPEPSPINLKRETEVSLDPITSSNLKSSRFPSALFSNFDSARGLAVGDVITVQIKDHRPGTTKELALVTNVRKQSYGALLGSSPDEFALRRVITAQLGDSVREADELEVVDIKMFYEWQIQKS